MFTVYYAHMAIACFASRDEADQYIRNELLTHGIQHADNFTVDFEEENEDRYYSINR